MKTITKFPRKINCFNAPAIFFICLVYLISPSCEKAALDQGISPDLMPSAASSKKIKHTGKVKDVDGNWYNTVNIGTQEWMAENLKTTKFNDKTPIPIVTDNELWATATTSAFCWYENNPTTYKDLYGGLYNWYAVNTGNLCPNGWHVPTDAEWGVLVTYLGGQDVAGSKLRSTGTLVDGNGLWYSPNTASNSSGFTALPAGGRVADEGYHGVFLTLGYSAYFWSNSADSPDSPVYWWLWGQTEAAWRATFINQTGFSVRCLKD